MENPQSYGAPKVKGRGFFKIVGGLHLHYSYIECDYLELGRPKAKASSQQVRGLRQRKDQCLHANPDEENQLVLSQG